MLAENSTGAGELHTITAESEVRVDTIPRVLQCRMVRCQTFLGSKREADHDDLPLFAFGRAVLLADVAVLVPGRQAWESAPC